MQPPLSSASPASSSPGRAAAAAGGKKPSFSSPSPSSFSPLEISTVIAPFADKLLDLTIGRYQVVEHGRPQDFFAFHAACREDLVQHLTSFLSVDVSQVAAAAAAANRKKKGTQRRGSSGAGEEGTEEEEVVDLDEEEAEFRDLQRRAELLVEKALPHHPAAASLLSLSSLPTTAAGAGSSSGGQDVSSSLKPNSHHQNQSSESISAVTPPAAHNGYSQMHQSFQQQQQEGVVAGDDEGEQQQQQQNPQQQKAAWDALLAQRQSTTELFLRSTVAELIAALEVNESRLSQTEAKVGARDASLAQQRGMYLREVTYLREMIRQFREKGRCELPDIALLQSDQQLFHNNSKGEGGAGGDGNNSTCRGAAASDNVGASMIHEKREAMAKEEQRDAVEKQLRGQIHELNFKIRSLEAQSAIQQSLHQQVLTLQEQLKAQKQSAAKMEEIHEALRQEVATLTQQLESDPAAMLHAAAMTSRNHSSKADLSCDAAVQYEPPSPHRAGSVIDLSVEASFHEVFQNTSAAAAGGGGAPDNLLLGEGVRKSISVPQPPPPSLDLKGAKKDGGKAATTTTPRRGSDASLSGRKHNTPTNSPRSTTTGKGRGATAGESKKTLTPRRAAAIAAQAQQQVSPSSTPSLLPAAVNHSSGSGEHHPAAGASVSDGGASCTSPWHRDDDPHLHGGEPSTPQQRLPVPLPSASSFSANPSPTPSPSSQLSPMSGWQAEVRRLRAENLLLQERLAQHQQRQEAEEQHHQQPRGSSVTPSSTGLPNPPTTSPAKLRLLQDELHKKNQLLDQKSAELAQLQSETMRWFQQYKERIPSSAAEVSDIHFPSLRAMRDALRGAVIEEKLYRHLSWKLIRDHQRYRQCQQRHEEELTVAKGTRQIGPNPALATKLQRQQAAMVQCHEGKLERLRRARREARDKANGHWDEVLLYARRLFVSVQLCEKQMDDALPVETDLQTRGGEAPHERNHSAAPSSSHLVGGRFPSSAAVPHRSGASPLSVKMDRNGEEDPSSLIVEVPHIVPRAVNHVLLPANTTAAANGEQQQQEGLLLDTSQQQQQKSTRPSSAVGLHQAAAAVSGSTRKRPMSASVTRPVAAVAASRAATYTNNPPHTTISASQHHHYGSRAASQFHPADLRTATPSDRRRMILQALRGSRGPEQGPSSSSHPHCGSDPSLVTEVALNPPAHLDQPPPPQQQQSYGNARPSSASAYHRRVYHDQNFQNSSPLRSAEQQQVQDDRDRARQSDLYRGSVLRHHGPILTTTMPQQGNNSGSRSDAVPPTPPDDERVLQAVRNAGMIRTARLIGRFEKL